MSQRQDIAIVGMAGLYAGSDDIDVFWSNILNKKDVVTESPDGWLGDGQIFAPDSEDLFRIYTRRGGFLGDLSRFDARVFGTMPLSVVGAQPDQFLALKLARDALIDARCEPGKFDGSRTGVILGHAVHAHRANTNGIHQGWLSFQTGALLKSLFPELGNDRIKAALDLMHAQLPRIAQDAVPGLVPNILTGRIANRLDLMGPNYIIDAACSSSIIAVQLAINELRSGSADIMLAGGVNTTTSPLVFAVFCSVGALSRTGAIRPFDSTADGTVLGEGAGVVVLKRLDDAIAADDRIYAVIKGVGQSSDGKSSGLMAPRLEGEMLAIRRAYEECGIDPSSIGLIEAHGTGIPLGDRTEVEALRTIFGERQGATPTVPIGSVKSMIGHCIPAAGSASIIKTALALKHKIVPPTICESVNSGIGLEGSPFYISTETRPWLHSAPTPRRAAINAFGFGGINAHMILEESPVGKAPDPTAAFSLLAPQASEREQVYFFAGQTRSDILAALDAVAAAVQDGTEIELAELSKESWDAASSTAGPQRLSIVASNRADLSKKIAAARAKMEDPETDQFHTRNGLYFQSAPIGGKVAFLFPGEMAQYPDMMKEAAIAFPVVREWFDLICSVVDGRRETRLQDVIYPPPTLIEESDKTRLNELMHRVDYGSEMVFAADQAAHSLLGVLGVKADAMLGHSTGENAALVASGLLELDREGVGRMIARMNDVFEDVEKSGVVPQGVLLTIAALDRPALAALLEARPRVHFTMDNCPNQAVIFGGAEDIDSLQSEAVAKGAVCTKLPISWGYHTEYVSPLAERFNGLFASVRLRPSDVKLYSCSTAAPFPVDEATFRSIAMNQYVSRVRFSEAVERLYEDGCRIFIECGPNANLTAFVRDILGTKPHLAESVDNRRRGLISQLSHLLARLFVAGVSIDPVAFLKQKSTGDQARRADERRRQGEAPKLPSELPCVRIDDEMAGELRKIVFGDLSGVQREPVADAPPSAQTNGEATGSALANGVGEALRPLNDGPLQRSSAKASAVNGHLALMSEFLASQGKLAMELMGEPGLSAQSRGARSQDGNGVKIASLSFAHKFPTPFPFQAYMMGGRPSIESVLPYLAEAERAEAREIAEKKGASAAWAEWALSRLSVKRAACVLAFGSPAGFSPQNKILEVRKTDEGAPYLFSPAPSEPLPTISIAHAGGFGLGAAADPNWRIGLDYDSPWRIRDPEGFLETILGDDERRLLSLAPTHANGAVVWTIKEAAAKALGVGVRGRPRDFAILEMQSETGAALVAYGAHRLNAFVRPIGDGVCAISYFRLS